MKTTYLEQIESLKKIKPRVIAGRESETMESLMKWRDIVRTYENKLRSEK